MVMNRQQTHAFMTTYFEDEHDELLDDSQFVIDHQGQVSILVPCSLRRRVPHGMMPVKLKTVDGDFHVSHRVHSLHNMPDVVVGEFACAHCDLTSLVGAPPTVYESFDCSHNQLTSLQHAPGGHIEISCDHNLLTDLSTVPACDFLWALHNPLTSLQHVPDHVSRLAITVTPHLSLLHLVTCACEKVDVYHSHNDQVDEILQPIINKYLGKGKGYMLNFANELKQAGYVGNAKW
jgi:hypothetical protein